MEHKVSSLNIDEGCTVTEREDPPSLRHQKNITESQWNDWKWQLRNSINDLKTLSNTFNLSSDEDFGADGNKQLLPMKITPYYASLMDKSDPEDPLRKAVVPTILEYKVSEDETADSLGEELDSPIPNLVHRYPDRVLFLITNSCGVYCRYCTRSHMVAKEKQKLFTNQFEEAFKYIENHTEIRDVILSGGDPLTLDDNKIEYFLKRLRAIPHIEIIRIGTKVPAILPQRITDDLVNMLKKYHPLYMSLHFTHPNEITQECKQACEKLANAGIVLGSQTVLLKGINDNAEVLKDMYHKLLMARVKPYYLYMMDKIIGGGHFSTTIEDGLEIMSKLRGWTSGYAIPHFIVDTHEGKIALLPECMKKNEDGNYTLTSFKGKIVEYKRTS